MNLLTGKNVEDEKIEFYYGKINKPVIKDTKSLTLSFILYCVVIYGRAQTRKGCFWVSGKSQYIKMI
jgi:hypothetical protein